MFIAHLKDGKTMREDEVDWKSVPQQNISSLQLAKHGRIFTVTADGSNWVQIYGNNIPHTFAATGTGGASWTGYNTKVQGFMTWKEIIVDTCTAPGSGNWAVDCLDNCTFDANQDVPGNMTINGAGQLTLSKNLTFTGSDQHISIGSGCDFVIESGGRRQ